MGNPVVELRRRHDLTQGELALKCSLSMGSVWMVEKGIQSRLPPKLAALANVLDGVGAGDLLATQYRRWRASKVITPDEVAAVR